MYQVWGEAYWLSYKCKNLKIHPVCDLWHAIIRACGHYLQQTSDGNKEENSRLIGKVVVSFWLAYQYICANK